MSTILKALRRLEQEKTSRSDRPLSEAVANTPPLSTERSNRLRWWIGGGSLVGVIAVAALVLLWGSGGDTPSPEVAEVPDRSAPQVAHAEPEPAANQAAAAARRARGERLQAARATAQSATGNAAEGGAAGLSPEALNSEVEVVVRPRPTPEERAAALSKRAPPVVLSQREPPRPGAHPVEPTEQQLALAAAPEAEPQAPQADASAPNGPVVTSSGVSPAERVAAAQRASALARAAANAAQPPAPALPEAKPPAVAPATGAPAGEILAAATPPAPAVATAEVTPAPPPVVVPSEPSPAPPRAAELSEPVRVAAATPARPNPSPARPAAAPRAAPVEPEPPAPKGEVLKPLPAAKATNGSAGAAAGVYVERTIWHPRADRRVAIVALGAGDDRIEVREGDTVGTLIVGEIEPAGVTFLRDGVEVRRRVGVH